MCTRILDVAVTQMKVTSSSILFVAFLIITEKLKTAKQILKLKNNNDFKCFTDICLLIRLGDSFV